MGKKARKEREEKRESFAAKRSSEKRSTNLKAIGVLAIIAAIGSFAAYEFVTMEQSTMGAPNKVQIMDKSSLPEPGHWTIVCQLFKAPEETGIYMSYWRMHDSKNDAFGERFRVKIRVSA